tara:strand:- start:19542 stop:19943 length:402 start_codon:yes stop_codon:yes gene_type:complete
MRSYQKGQSMVEYVVIIGALSAALILPGLGSIGIIPTDQDSVLEGFSNKHRGHGFAISLSEMPETDSLAELAAYYERLGKYPELTPQLKAGSQKLGMFSNRLTEMGNFVKKVNPNKIKFPPKVSGVPSLPSFP